MPVQLRSSRQVGAALGTQAAVPTGGEEVLSRNGTKLPTAQIPPEGIAALNELLMGWPDVTRWPYRSRWLRDFEDVLRRYFPRASSADLRLTARSYAPFPLAAGPNVP